MASHILIVDDCEDVRFLLALKLNNMGFEVSEASDGQDAYEMIKDIDSEHFDVLLCDVVMPKLTGSELMAKLRKHNLTKNTKIIFITAHYDEELYSNLREMGAHDVLKKPIKGNELNKRLQQIIGRAS